MHTHTQREREKHQHKPPPSRDRVASSVGDAAQRLPASLPSITIITIITIIIIINRPQRQRNRCVVARIAPRDASASTGCLAALRLKASGLWMRTHARTHARTHCGCRVVDACCAMPRISSFGEGAFRHNQV